MPLSYPLLILTFLILLITPSLSNSPDYFEDDSLFLENPGIVAAAQTNGKPRVDFFVESLSDSAMTFFKDFGPIYEQMKEDIDFIPHYIFKIYGPAVEKNFTTDIPDCVSGGRFCVRNNASIFENWVGRDIVMQSIREICIYKKSPEKWWEYQMKLAECDKACYDDAYSQLGLSQEEIYKCATDSFINGNEMNDNTLLRDAKTAAKVFPVEGNQNVFIDVKGLKYRERSLPVSVLAHRICILYSNKLTYCKNVKNTENTNTNNTNTTIPPVFSGFQWFMIFTALVFVAYMVYIKYTNKSKDPIVGIQLDETVSQYFALEDEDTKKAIRRISMQKLEKERKSSESNQE